VVVPPGETGWGIWDGDRGFNKIVAGSGETRVDSVSTVVLFFLFGRKAVKSRLFLFFEGPGFSLGEGFSGKVRTWDLALVCGLETEPVGVLFLLRMGGDGGVRGSSLGTEIVGPTDSAKRGDSAVGSTGVLSCCPSGGVWDGGGSGSGACRGGFC